MKPEICVFAALVCAAVFLLSLHPARVRAEGNPPDRETVYQVALLQSLVQGQYDGTVTVGELKKHGDTGIGTFDGVNGEMIVLDGVVYQAIHDGSILIPPDSETVPFSNVTFFEADVTVSLTDLSDMDALKERLNQVVNEHGANLFYMVKITGFFPHVKMRSEYRQLRPYRALDAALAADQVEYDAENVRGTMVGLYCPSFMSGLNTPGWHFHLITEDRSLGGHLLQVSVGSAQASFDTTPGFTMALPDANDDFQRMDLSRNVDEAIHRAETATSSDVPAEEPGAGGE